MQQYRQPVHLSGKRRDNVIGFLTLYFDQDCMPGLPFDQCSDLTVVRTDYEVTFPMSRGWTMVIVCAI